MARANKFASVNLNDFYGKKEPAVKTAAVSGSGSAVRQRGTGHGGMLVLTRPVKQQVKIGGGNLGVNLKKEDHESLAAAANNTGSWTKNSSAEFADNATIVDKSETSHLKNKRDVYVPPAVRTSEAISVPVTSSNVPRFTAEKAEVLSGEEFPTLQASLAPENTNGQQQRMKDSQQKQKDKETDEKQQQEKLRQMSLQATLKADSHSVEPVVDRLQPMWSQLRPQQKKGDQGFVSTKSEAIIGRSDGPRSGNSDLTSGYDAPEWTDDERANGFRARPGSATANWRQGSGSSRPLEYAQADSAVDVIEEPLVMENWHDKKAVSPLGSGGGRYQREPFPRPGSGGYRYESDSSPRPGSRGFRYESGTSPRLSSGVRNERSERDALFRPGSGGGMYEREVISRPGSGGRHERDVTSRPGSGGRHENEIISQLGSRGDDYNARPVSGGRYERGEMPRPGSGGGYYPRPGSGGRYERDVMPQPSSGGGYYPQPGSGGSSYEREVISRPLSGGSGDYSRAGSAGVDYRRMRPGSGGNDGMPGGERYSNRDLSSNGKQNFDRQVANPSRGYGSDVHYRGQNIRNTYESNREKGSFRDNWFRPGGMSGELPNSDEYGRGQASHEDYGAYDGRSLRGQARQSAADGRSLGQLREREEGFAGYTGVPGDDTLQRSWDEEKGLSITEEEQRKANAKDKLFQLEDNIPQRESEQKWETENVQKMREKGIYLHDDKECSSEQEVSVGNLDQRPRLQIKEEHNSLGKDSRVEQHQNEPISYSKRSDYYSKHASGQGTPSYPCRSSMSWREPSIGAPGPKFSQPHVKTISRNLPSGSVNTGKYQLF